ncbi:MAG: DUF1501 domain-containing protein [Planctomycetes bacterium]|nr:DUF1501 domain-containing protein [Planctomycetota bacterium]
MFTIGDSTVRNCGGITRREMLRIGGLSLAGLTLADLFRSAHASPDRERREAACIFLWLDGGPSHLETFDPKPETPDTIRGPYGAIPTNVPGIQIGELLPRLSQHMDKCVLVRSMNHGIDSHSPVPMLTGFAGETTSYGAVISRIQGYRGNMPPYVHVGSRLGVGGGRLGAPYFPVEIADPTGNRVQLPQFALSADIRADRFTQRRELLAAIDRFRQSAHGNQAIERMDQSYQRAVDILTSTQVRDAFDLSREPAALRERYGANLFGQSCLLARRLVQAGSRFIQVKWYDGPAWDAWDVHGADLGGMVRMEQHLCPRLDQGLSALLSDLHDRRMLRSTLIVVGGEFGRTPRLNRSGARDHFPYCFSYLLAGGGLEGGRIVGSSDRTGSRPANVPVSPAQFAATLYRLVGIDTTDARMRPFLREALPVQEIVG